MQSPGECRRVIFIDELFARMHATRARMWARRGIYPRLPSWDHHGKWTVYGAVDVRTGEFQSVVAAEWNNEMLRGLLEQIVSEWGEEGLLIVWDNGRIHHAKAVQTWFEAHPGVRLWCLPPYCSELDPVEMIWRQLRRAVTDNHIFTAMDELKAVLEDWLQRASQQPRSVFAMMGIDPTAPEIRLQMDRPHRDCPNGLRLIAV